MCPSVLDNIFFSDEVPGLLTSIDLFVWVNAVRRAFRSPTVGFLDSVHF